MTPSIFKGTGVALVTPFDEKFAVDYQSLGNLLEFQSNQHTNYFVVQGTTGESPTVSDDEKKKILAFVLENNPKKLPVVLGIGGNNTFALIREIENTDFSGVDAILSVSPYYNKPSQRGIVNHYELLANACPVPIILYNVPGRTGSNMQAATSLTLSQHDNIIAIKEASGDLSQCQEIFNGKPENFQVISGDDMLTVDLINMGGIGVISVLANAFPGIFHNITQGAFQNDENRYIDSFKKLQHLNPLIYEESSATGIKLVLSELGICKPTVRPPLYAASNNLVERIKKVLVSFD